VSEQIRHIVDHSGWVTFRSPNASHVLVRGWPWTDWQDPGDLAQHLAAAL